MPPPPPLPFRVCTYNVLAQCLAKSSYFPSSGPALKWKARFPRLCDTVTTQSADVLSLSEVDNILFWAPFLRSLGYSFAYKLRTGRAYGSLIAWRTSVFEAMGQAAASDLNDLAVCGLTVSDAPAPAAAIIGTPRDATGLHVALRFRASTDAGLVVSTSHLYFDPAAAVLKSAQGGMLALCAGTFGCRAAAQHPDVRRWGHIVAGDFNSLPGHDAHLVFSLPGSVPFTPGGVGGAASSGGSDRLAWDCGGVVLSGETEAGVPAPAADGGSPQPYAPSAEWLAQLRQHTAALLSRVAAVQAGGGVDVAPSPAYSLSLRSGNALKLLPEGGAAEGVGPLLWRLEPPFTTYTAGFKGCLDYIFCGYTGDAASLRVTAVDPLPTREQLTGPDGVVVTAPSAEHPSDHFPVTATCVLG